MFVADPVELWVAGVGRLPCGVRAPSQVHRLRTATDGRRDYDDDLPVDRVEGAREIARGEVLV
jgi:hypothetical protein